MKITLKLNYCDFKVLCYGKKGTANVCRDYEPTRKVWLMYVGGILV